jgi:RHS repeat-associated protein
MASNRLRRKPANAKSIRVADYGYRYYDPLTGRWPSRDPIEEKGGLNLYGFVANNPIVYTDNLGLFNLKLSGMFGVLLVVRVSVELDYKNDGNCICGKISYEGEAGLGAGAGARQPLWGAEIQIGAMLAGLGRKSETAFVVCRSGSFYSKQRQQLINFSKFLSVRFGTESEKFNLFMGAGISIDIELDVGVDITLSNNGLNVAGNSKGFFKSTGESRFRIGSVGFGDPDPIILADEPFYHEYFNYTAHF